MPSIIEDTVEQAALAWLADIGYEVAHGPNIAHNMPAAERESYDDVVLVGRLRGALYRLNPELPDSAIDEAVRRLTRNDSPNLFVNNHDFNKLLIEGVPVNYQNGEGRTVYVNARIVDFSEEGVADNDWLAVNQFTVRKHGAVVGQGDQLEGTRRPDIVLFVNGLPLGVIELKNAADEDASIHDAFNQLQTYKEEIPDLFVYNEAMVVSDGVEARLGTLTSGFEWYKRWRSVDGQGLENGRTQLEVLIRGVFAPERFLDIVRYFTFFEVSGSQVVKKVAQYHQYFAANNAVQQTLRAVGLADVQDEQASEYREKGDQRAGVIWHTQGSGKSLTMLFYAGKIIQHPLMQNPTLVVLTDRNDLDDQLLGNTFAPGYELLRQVPVQASSREDLREKLRVASGGVVFTTIQKFMPDDDQLSNPVLSDRRNIVFIVDEAHRTQYGFEARYHQTDDGVQKVYGLAKYMRDALPNATFIGFTGTPVSQTDRNTRNVFGEYIDIYDIQRAVEDKATVPIYYDARYARMKLNEAMVPRIDPEFEEITEGEEPTSINSLQSKWAAIAAIVGEPDRIELVAHDIVEHFEQRDAAMPGKAMIVCMSRDICVRMHDAIIALRPDWYDSDDSKGVLKVVMTGSASDGPEWQQHVRNKTRRKALADRFRDDSTDFKLVIVRDMWLTGFDAPSMHTMYVDKPMRGHNLMQAIARVNRVYPGKDGGLVVAYLPLQRQLQSALQDYTDADRELAGKLQDDAAAIMKEKYEVVAAMFHGFDYSTFFTESPAERLTTLSNAVEFILQGREENRTRYINNVTALGQAYALANPHPDAVAIREDLGFFQAVKAPLVKMGATKPHRNGLLPEDIDKAVQQIVDNAVAPDGIIDLFEVAGLNQPNISLLSDEFLLEVQMLPQKNLAVELLRRLIEGEIRDRRRDNLVQARSFAEMLKKAVERYNDEAIAAGTIINELIALAIQMRDAQYRGKELGLSSDELAFYDALSANESAVDVMGDEQLAVIARELVTTVRRNATIDWAVTDSARAKMRTAVKRILRRYGYPPDLQVAATKMVVQQAELFASVEVA